jgi:hypothetical protein
VTKAKDGTFYKSTAEWQNETGLSRHEQDTARKILKRKGFLADERRGTPPRVYYKLNELAIAKAISNLPKSGKLICRKTANQNAEIRQTGMPLFGKSSYQTKTTAENTGSSMASAPPTPAAQPAAASLFDYETRLRFVLATKKNKRSPEGLAHHLANGDDDVQIRIWLEQQAERERTAAAMIAPTDHQADLTELADDILQRQAAGQALSEWESQILNFTQGANHGTQTIREVPTMQAHA